MPRLKEGSVPKYRLHKASGQGIVTISGQDRYLGTYGTKASRRKYDALIGEWLASGRAAAPTRVAEAEAVFTVLNLIAAYRRHCVSYYPKNTFGRIKPVLKAMKELYADLPANEFSPLKLKAVRQWMMEQYGWTRKTINEGVRIVKHMFKWGAGNELVSGSVYYSLLAVEGLKKGRSAARETEPVQPVPEAYVDAIKDHLAPQVWDMIQIQLLTGMRPGEAVIMRGCDIDTTARIWVYKPQKHKTEHLEQKRLVYLGPQAQEIVKRNLKSDMTAYLFSPADADAWHRQQKRDRRKTPEHHGTAPGENRKRSPKWAAGDRYTVASYRRAIERACDIAFPPPEALQRKRLPANGRKAKNATRWEDRETYKNRLIKEKKWEQLQKWRHDHRWHPNQLRHNAATRLRRDYGIDIAQTILGHRLGSGITEIYAEANVEKAKDVLAKIG